MKGSSCLGAAVHCVQDDFAGFWNACEKEYGGPVRATKVAPKVTTKYPFNFPTSIGFFEGTRRSESPLLRFGYVRCPNFR